MADREPSPELSSPTFVPRIGTQHLFWATALIAVGVAYHASTIALSLAIILLWARYFTSSFKWGSWLSVALLTFFVFCSALFFSVPEVKQTARAFDCRNYMRQLALAIHNYESTHGHLPCDTETTNSKGEIIRTSWRVHILPFLDAYSPHADYQFDQPWDSPANLALQYSLSPLFSCPAHGYEFRTTYKAVVGPGTAFVTGKGTAFGDCVDGTSNTIILVEDHANPVHIFEPSDISVADVVKLFNHSSKANCAHQWEFISSRHQGFNFALLDSSVHTWPANPQTVVDKGAFLIADSKLFDPETDIPSCFETRWDRIITLTIYVVLVAYPLRWRYKKRRARSVSRSPSSTATVS